MEYRATICFVVAGMVALGKCAVTPQPGIIASPGPDFQMDENASFSCYTCHPNMPACGNRIDCCTEVNPLQIQACPASSGKVCYKKVTKTSDSLFYNTTRGCGKLFGGGPASQSDTDCSTINSATAGVGSTECNCVDKDCNTSSHFSVSHLLPAFLTTVLVVMLHV